MVLQAWAFILFGVLFVILCILIWLVPKYPGICNEKIKRWVISDSDFLTITMDKFLKDMEKEKPIRFTNKHLRLATNNYSYRLGSGGFGTVYKGVFNDGTVVAVKVLNGSSDDIIEKQFMAEVSTIGKIHHFNLVRLCGFCFERELIALVYEYMVNGSLDKYLFHENNNIGFEKLHRIAIGTAKGIAYLHEECQHRIIHYDIKPGNILLDNNFNPKVADFGLAKLCNRDNTHMTVTRVRGTPGYAAPELWMRFTVTYTCDVYSFGILLFEIIGRRRHHNTEFPESQEWFPKWVWKRFDAGELEELIIACGIEEENKESIERMINVALLCVQYRPESRPAMSVVVKMLEGSVQIPKPLNPFPHLIDEIVPSNFVPALQNNIDTSTGSGSSEMITEYPAIDVRATVPIVTKLEIEPAST